MSDPAPENEQKPAGRMPFMTVMVCVALTMIVLVGAGVYFSSPDQVVKSKPKAVQFSKPVSTVEVPAYFERYADVIRQADLKIENNRLQMKNGATVTLSDLHGFFAMPLRQKVVYGQIRVPGDPRAYRKGVHQGIDFYQTRSGDPIYAAAPGVVIRIDHEYKPIDKKVRDELLKFCESRWNGTPGSVGVPPVEEPYGNVLDKLSGRQVLIYHGKNAQNEPIISLYAHLSDVGPHLAQNELVTIDTIVGYLGNTGTSGEANQTPQIENHLHLELFVGGMYWTPKSSSEIGRKQSGARYTELQKKVLQELSSGVALPGK